MVWRYTSEAVITALPSPRDSEGVLALCILGNISAIGKIQKCELGIILLLVKSLSQTRHISPKSGPASPEIIKANDLEGSLETLDILAQPSHHHIGEETEAREGTLAFLWPLS